MLLIPAQIFGVSLDTLKMITNPNIRPRNFLDNLFMVFIGLLRYMAGVERNFLLFFKK